ncbi:MAG: hydrogenase maturation nickel metallochaperone HypA [Pseudomonadota bacterium]
MHEMPFTQALIELALDKAEGKKILKIHLRVGWLSSIVPESVQVFFDHLSRDTLAEGAALDFEFVPISLACQACGRVLDLPYQPSRNPRQALAQAFRDGCPCGAGKLSLAGGLGFDVAGVEIEDSV